MRLRSLALGLLPLAALALYGAVQKPTEAKLKAEWSAFLKDYDAAYKVWLKPYTDAKTDEERSKVKLDFDNQPSKKFLPKAQAFAERARGTEHRLSALLWVYQYAQDPPPAPTKTKALDAIVKEYVKSPQLVRLAQGLQFDGYYVGEKKAEQTLNTLLAKSPVEDVRAQALLSLGAMNMPYQDATPEQAKKAKGYFARLMKEFPSSKAAGRAKGAIFELENLQIGMPAPDFEAEDENGVKFKLSDYKGKVVILDFWGFW